MLLDQAHVDKTLALLKAGEVLVFPTETVYGVGGDAASHAAVGKIYEIKARATSKPITIHVSDATMAKRYVEWTDTAEKLTRAFWPGPLTLVLKRKYSSALSEKVNTENDSIGVRAPSHPIFQQLVKAFGSGIAASSANRSGQSSPVTAEQARAELGNGIFMIDGGACEVGLASTVLDITGASPAILRAGSITEEMIKKVLG